MDTVYVCVCVCVCVAAQKHSWFSSLGNELPGDYAVTPIRATYVPKKVATVCFAHTHTEGV